MIHFIAFFILNLASTTYVNIPNPHTIETSQISLQTPSNWKQQEVSDSIPKNSTTLVEAKSDTEEASLKLFIHPTEGGVKLEGLDSPQSLGDLSSVWSGYRLIDSGETEIDDQEAVWHIVELSSQNSVRMLQYVTYFDGNIYELSFTAPQNTFKEWIPLFQEIAQSLKFKKNLP